MIETGAGAALALRVNAVRKRRSARPVHHSAARLLLQSDVALKAALTGPGLYPTLLGKAFGVYPSRLVF
jgi:hypothetical protein